MIAILLVAIYSIAFCGDENKFRIVKFEDVGGNRIAGPLKWAPSGDKIAYTRQSNIVVADTLGQMVKIFITGLQTHGFEWLSDKELVVFEKSLEKRIAHIRLVRYDITTGDSETIQEFRKNWPLGRGLIDEYFEGPYLTVQGNLYYYLYKDGVKVPTFPESKYQIKVQPENNHIYKLTPGGLCLIRADLQDSIFAYDDNYADTVQSLKQKYYIRGGFVTNLKDSSSILIDTFPVLKNIQKSYLGCGFMNEDINPLFKEIVFLYGCDIDEHTSTGFFFFMDLDSNMFINLSQEVNEEECQTARFSPDGRRISMSCSGCGYILYR